MHAMKRLLLLNVLALAGCGDTPAEIELVGNTYVLVRVERTELPVAIERGSVAGGTFEGRVIGGSLRFFGADSLNLVLQTDYVATDSTGRPLAAEEGCQQIVLPYRRGGTRVFVGADTLVVTGRVISGRRKITASNNAPRTVQLDFLAGVPGQLRCF